MFSWFINWLIGSMQPPRRQQVEKVRELARLEAWEKEQTRRASREATVFNREENDRLVATKAAERKARKIK